MTCFRHQEPGAASAQGTAVKLPEGLQVSLRPSDTALYTHLCKIEKRNSSPTMEPSVGARTFQLHFNREHPQKQAIEKLHNFRILDGRLKPHPLSM